MIKDKIKYLLQKSVDFLNEMNTKTIEDSYKKVAAFEAIKAAYDEVDKPEQEEENDAGTDH